jgi:cyclophilin family peptidyl-prolyl cis-trans isomerase
MRAPSVQDLALVLLAGLAASPCVAQQSTPAGSKFKTPAQPGQSASTPAGADEWVVLQTTVGPVVLDLFEAETPTHAENFKKLVRQGYYDGSPFHRVIEGFMAQGGGRWGASGQIEDVGYRLPAEIKPVLRHERGTLAAARKPDQVNPAKESSGSQFYICFAPASHLDGDYTVFGKVVQGMENVDKIQRNPSKMNATMIGKAWLEPAGSPFPPPAAK